MPLGSILGAVGGAKGLFDLGIGGASLLKGGGGKKAHRRAMEMARLQAQLNKDAALQTAMLNNYAQTTPFASSQFVGTPGTADYRREVTLDPAEQALLDQQRGLKGNIGAMIGGQVLPSLSQVLARQPMQRQNLQQVRPSWGRPGSWGAR